MNILQVRSNTRASPLTDPYPDNIRMCRNKARKSGGRETSLVACQTDRFEGYDYKPSNLPHPVPRLEHYVSVDRPRNVKVDLDIVRRGYVDAFLLRKSTPSIPLFVHTQRILCSPDTVFQGPSSRLSLLSGPRPPLPPEMTHLPDVPLKSTTQHSSTDLARLYISCSRTCSPSLK